MSRLGSFLAGVGFRTATPAFEPGETVTLIVTGLDGDVALARVGDTVLRVRGAPEAALDKKVRIEITSFDGANASGEAEFLDVVGESAF